MSEPTPRIHQYKEAIDLMATGKSFTAIAKELQIDRSTLWMWRQDPAFRALHKNLCDGAVTFARNELRLLAVDAVAAVADCLQMTQGDEQRKTNTLRRAAACDVFKAIGLFDAHDKPVEGMSDEELVRTMKDLGVGPVSEEAN